ncbi:hypothetical protein VTI74DRAFT_9611 [Chaetomium olivicolor]
MKSPRSIVPSNQQIRCHHQSSLANPRSGPSAHGHQVVSRFLTILRHAKLPSHRSCRPSVNTIGRGSTDDKFSRRREGTTSGPPRLSVTRVLLSDPSESSAMSPKSRFPYLIWCFTEAVRSSDPAGSGVAHHVEIWGKAKTGASQYEIRIVDEKTAHNLVPNMLDRDFHCLARTSLGNICPNLLAANFTATAYLFKKLTSDIAVQ